MANDMTRARLSTSSLRWLLELGACLLALGCQEPAAGPTAGSNSNWLLACSTDRDCEPDLACHCGGCTRDCESDADCSDLAGARCAQDAELAHETQCRAASAMPSGICLPGCEPGTCFDGQACVGGSCVLVTLPSSAMCAPVAPAGPEQRQWEDQLLALLNETRATGGVSCGTEAPSTSAGALRIDARLLCAARVFGGDLELSRARSLVDSAGRGSQQRMNEAGYSSQSWAEAFAFSGSSPNDALSIMLADADSCHGLMAASNEDVGVAHIGDVDVLSLASE